MSKPQRRAATDDRAAPEAGAGEHASGDAAVRERVVARLVGSSFGRTDALAATRRKPWTTGRGAADATVVDALLASRPGLAASVAEAIENAETEAPDERALLTALARQRAKLVSQAELHHVATTAPKAATALLDDLAEYLARAPEWQRPYG